MLRVQENTHKSVRYNQCQGWYHLRACSGISHTRDWSTNYVGTCKATRVSTSSDVMWAYRACRPPTRFRKGRSTTTALHIIITGIQKGLNQRKPNLRTVMIALGLSRAFDTVINSVVLQNILTSTLPSSIKRLLANYVRGRQTFVEFQGTSSKYTFTCPPCSDPHRKGLIKVFSPDFVARNLQSGLDSESCTKQGIVLRSEAVRDTCWLREQQSSKRKYTENK